MQKKILELLTKTDGYVSGSEISEQLGVARQAVWKAMNNLKEQGYKIDSVTNRGYRLVAYPPHLNEPAIEKYLKTSVIGKKLIVLDEVGSTNDYLKKLGADGCENGTVAVAREQTQGKGRLGRVWKAKKDDSITFSFLLRPKIAPSEVSSITPLAGLAVCKAIREFTGLDCRIKWPNDIIIGKKKLVGILTEMSAEFDAVEYVITGIGINADTQDFPDDIKEKATSIYLATIGSKGLVEVAEQSVAKAHYLAEELSKAGLTLKYQQSYFHEFVTVSAKNTQDIMNKLAQNNILGGLPLNEREILWCATEMNTKEEIDKLVELVKAV